LLIKIKWTTRMGALIDLALRKSGKLKGADY
jgi:hypothetical protein